MGKMWTPRPRNIRVTTQERTNVDGSITMDEGRLTLTEKLGNEIAVETLDMFDGTDGAVYVQITPAGGELAQGCVPIDLTLVQQKFLLIFLLENILNHAHLDEQDSIRRQLDAILVNRMEASAVASLT